MTEVRKELWCKGKKNMWREVNSVYFPSFKEDTSIIIQSISRNYEGRGRECNANIHCNLIVSTEGVRIIVL